jgi:hypothetical protein
MVTLTLKGLIEHELDVSSKQFLPYGENPLQRRELEILKLDTI